MVLEDLQVDMEMPPKSRFTAKRKRRFKTRWVKLHLRWAEALRKSKSVSTYQLAHTILFEAFKREQVGGEMVLSMQVTNMPSSTRERATKELIKLGLIKVRRNGKQAIRVIKVIY
jgi:hypothetical protein